MCVKKATTVQEQIEKLKSRGCSFENETKAAAILERINYYRLTAYFLTFKKEDGTYINGTSFETVYKIYEFDKELRKLIFSEIESIEIMLRTKTAYYFSHKYGPLGYLDENNFNNRHKTDKFEEKINKAIQDNKTQPFVKHHIENKGSKFPLWVSIELFSFGMLSIFYADLLAADKKALSELVTGDGNNHKNLESWLFCISHLRNWCAHYSRLYYNKFGTVPATPKSSPFKYNDRLFGYLMAMKNVCPDKEKWNFEFINNLDSLISKYKNYIDVKHLGFYKDWKKNLMI